LVIDLEERETPLTEDREHLYYTLYYRLTDSSRN
jgi:hypothetical protein